VQKLKTRTLKGSATNTKTNSNKQQLPRAEDPRLPGQNLTAAPCHLRHSRFIAATAGKGTRLSFQRQNPRDVSEIKDSNQDAIYCVSTIRTNNNYKNKNALREQGVFYRKKLYY